MTSDRKITIFYWVVTALIALFGSYAIMEMIHSYGWSRVEALLAFATLQLVALIWPLVISLILDKVKVE